MEENKYSQDESVIDLRELWFVFQQHLLAILLITVLVGGGVFAFFRFYVAPTYSTTAKLYVVSASNDSVVNLSDLQIGTNLTSDYQELLLSRPMMESVIRKLDLDMSVGALRNHLTITNPSGTRILSITATMEGPETAADVANAMAKLAVTWLPEVMECNAPNIAEEAVVNDQPSGPHTLRNAVLAAAISAALTYAIYLVMYLMDDTIRTAEDMEKCFDLIPLTSVPLAPELKRKKSIATKSSSAASRKKGHRTDGGKKA